MSNITIDIDALTAALAQALPVAIKAAVNASIAQEEEKPETPPRKSGRPKKELPPTIKIVKNRKVVEVPTESLLPVGNVEIITVEDVDEILSEPEVKPSKPANNYTFAAKRVSSSGVERVQSATAVLKKPGDVKFVDVANIPHEKQSWEPTERRPPAKQQEFTCSRCRCLFKAYYSEIPQSLIKEKDPVTGQVDTPKVYCNDCSGMGK